MVINSINFYVTPGKYKIVIEYYSRDDDGYIHSYELLCNLIPSERTKKETEEYRAAILEDFSKQGYVLNEKQINDFTKKEFYEKDAESFLLDKEQYVINFNDFNFLIKEADEFEFSDISKYMKVECYRKLR